jgi:hypothetical protein
MALLPCPLTLLLIGSVLSHQVMDEHVEGDHLDLRPEFGEEGRIAAAFPDQVLVPGAACRAGDLVEDVAVALSGARFLSVLLA